MQSNGFDRKMISGDLKKNIFSNPKGGPLCFQKRKSALVGFFLEKNPMTNKIEKFLYILEHLIPDGRDEIPIFALYHPLLSVTRRIGICAAKYSGEVARILNIFTVGPLQLLRLRVRGDFPFLESHV